MRALSGFSRIRVCRAPVDFRKGMRGLAEIVQGDLGENPFDDCLFVFVNRARNSLKCLYWDRTGFAMWVKSLEVDRFPWPRDGENVITASHSQISWLLDGVDIWKLRTHKALEYSRVV
jgi:transposase